MPKITKVKEIKKSIIVREIKKEDLESEVQEEDLENFVETISPQNSSPVLSRIHLQETPQEVTQSTRQETRGTPEQAHLYETGRNLGEPRRDYSSERVKVSVTPEERHNLLNQDNLKFTNPDAQQRQITGKDRETTYEEVKLDAPDKNRRKYPWEV